MCVNAHCDMNECLVFNPLYRIDWEIGHHFLITKILDNLLQFKLGLY